MSVYRYETNVAPRGTGGSRVKTSRILQMWNLTLVGGHDVMVLFRSGRDFRVGVHQSGRRKAEERALISCMSLGKEQCCSRVPDVNFEAQHRVTQRQGCLDVKF